MWVPKLMCKKCGTTVLDSEPYDGPYFIHPNNPKKFCPYNGERLAPGMPGVAVYRSKSSRRARTRGARTAWKMTKKNTGKA